MSTKPQPTAAEEQVKRLLETSNVITFDSERGANQSDLCRREESTGKLQCVKVAMSSMQLFAFMGKQGFVCLNPSGDPSRTEIECRRIAEKSIDRL